LGSGDCKDQLALELRQLVHPVACVEGITQRLVLRPHPLPKKADDKYLQSHGREEDNRDDHGGQVVVIRHVKEMHGHGALDSGGAGELGHAGHRKYALDNLPQLMDPHQVTDALDQLLVDLLPPGIAIARQILRPKANPTHPQLQGTHVTREKAEKRRRIGVTGTVLDGLHNQSEELVQIDEHIVFGGVHPVHTEPGRIQEFPIRTNDQPEAT